MNRWGVFTSAIFLRYLSNVRRGIRSSEFGVRFFLTKEDEKLIATSYVLRDEALADVPEDKLSRI